MKRLYNFRLDTTLIKKVDKLEGSRTSIVTSALHEYVRGDTQKVYDVNMVDLLRSQVEDLRADKEYLQQQNNALLVARSPSLVEWFKYRLCGSE